MNYTKLFLLSMNLLFVGNVAQAAQKRKGSDVESIAKRLKTEGNELINLLTLNGKVGSVDFFSGNPALFAQHGVSTGFRARVAASERVMMDAAQTKSIERIAPGQVTLCDICDTIRKYPGHILRAVDPSSAQKIQRRKEIDAR